MKQLRIGFVVLVAALGLACGKKDNASKAEENPPPTEVEPEDKSPAPTPDAPAKAEIPTQEDFEEEAAGTITEDNLDKELDDLEKELENE